MNLRILDLDGSIADQALVAAGTARVALRHWGPRLRLACGFRRFRAFERDLADRLGTESDASPTMFLCGSGDFHHVSLALVRRQTRPFNLLVLDKHPDWMRGVPLLHCGTWLYHAARLPLVRHIYHVGGEVDFENAYRWMAPWDLLRSRRITVFPARRRYARGPWKRIAHEPLRLETDSAVAAERVADLLRPLRQELARHPLYVSLDKDVLRADEAVVNWDSGHLTWDDVRTVLAAFLAASDGRLTGLDTVGDWSPVRVQGILRRGLHWTEHPRSRVDPVEAAARNQRINLALIDTLRSRPARASA